MVTSTLLGEIRYASCSINLICIGTVFSAVQAKASVLFDATCYNVPVGLCRTQLLELGN
jgi:hypothetical protein